MPTWPAELPQHLQIKDYSETPQSQVIRSEMDAGPAKSRRRFTAASVTATARYLLSEAQRQAFEAFYENDIAGGALPFDWPRPRTGAAASVVMSGDPPYELKPQGDRWVLTLELEIQP